VPTRTFADWNDSAPGFMEIDLVTHSGDIAAGSFAHLDTHRHRKRLDGMPALDI
jgi:hypothetical protein